MYRELTRSEIVARYERRLAEARREIAEERALRRASEARERRGRLPWWAIVVALASAAVTGCALSDLGRAVPGPEVLAVSGGFTLLVIAAALKGKIG